ncbi:hypothetical protein [Algoriphagus sp. A40]|uniref:SRPBCC family protein n=1 Tax=Algoriphagus sp. A40 TaxID=1945863 RepID=UPI0009868DCE|nr:hypothetical protein [Algoriphagus sp. A40]OOG70448.1 hypothetical protein B0E43_17715 [Algoriphagus sp. A40]
MKIALQTSVEQSYLEVKSGFDQSLFKKLSPPFPPVRVLRFDGSRKGDFVTLELDFLFFRQKWTSEITEDRTTDLEFYFVDWGVELPFFLKKWKHTHRVISTGIGSVIRDEIEFEAPFGLMNYLLYPVLWVQFAYRKPVYRKIFKRSATQ